MGHAARDSFDLVCEGALLVGGVGVGLVGKQLAAGLTADGGEAVLGFGYFAAGDVFGFACAAGVSRARVGCRYFFSSLVAHVGRFFRLARWVWRFVYLARWVFICLSTLASNARRSLCSACWADVTASWAALMAGRWLRC